MAKTFVNQPNEMEVSLAIQRFLIGDSSATWEPTSGRIDPDNPPTGFVDLGAVVEDSPSISVTRNKFSLDSGIPAVRTFEAVIGLEGTVEFTLHSFSWRKVQFAFGNVAAVSSTTFLSTIASVTAQNVITFANTTDVESLVLGRQFVIAATAAAFDDADAVETRVESITSDGLTFLLNPTPLNTISADDAVGIYDFVQEFVGTNKLRQHRVLGVADFINGQQVVHDFFKVVPGDEFTEEISPGENQRTGLTFTAFGLERTDVPGCTAGQLVIARRVLFPAVDQSGLVC